MQQYVVIQQLPLKYLDMDIPYVVTIYDLKNTLQLYGILT